MAYSALTFLLKNVDNQLYDHLKLTSDAQDELKKLADELRSIKASLNNASYDKCNNEELSKEWERQCKAVVYELEDTIDSFITQSTQRTNVISRKLFQTTSGLRLAEEIKYLRENKLKPMIGMVYRPFPEVSIDQDAIDMSTKQARGAQRTKAPRQDNVVGFEDETEKLTGYLLEESSGLEVVSIIGMPGLGKTTVAWKIFQDPKIREKFPILIWVVVSQRLNKKDVLLTILQKFPSEDMSSKSCDELVTMVHSYLKRVRFLIFMDDVWTTDEWDEILDFLPKDNNMGRVLITTRNEKVGRYANGNREPHRLRYLTEEESLRLLRIEVFGELEEFPPELEEFGKRIAKKCEGLPLAIIVIGGILFDKLSIDGGNKAWKNEWEMVSESLGNYLIDQDNKARMKEIISFSYTKLRHDLRDCFLHLGMFPEDTEIPVWKLTRLWIAEGFIQEEPNGKSLEKIAEDYLDDLINRNLVIVEKTKLNGEVKTCRIHGTIHAFCRSIAGRNDQDLFEIINRSRDGVFLPPYEDMMKCRRICIHSFVEDFFLREPKLPYARSFLCFNKSPILLENKDIPSITDSFELLRIFDASIIKFPIFPIKFTKLIHLRYLTLSGDEFKILPEAMSKLWNLQTLIVNTMCSTLEIKANIWDMLQLSHVMTKASIILKKGGKGKGGENLQTLTRLSPESCTNDVFNKAKNLKSLGIRGQLNMILDSDCLETLERLEKLKLVNDVENPLHHFPRRLPLNIGILTLSNTYLDWMHMTEVGKLSTLEELKLKDNAFIGDSWDAVVGGFNKLEFLCISGTNLMFWSASGDSFPKLRSLVLKECEKLEEVPFELGKNLEMLSMERVTTSAVRSARKIEQAKKEMKGQQKTYNTTGGFKLIIVHGNDE